MTSPVKIVVALIVAVVVLYGGYRIYHHVTYKQPVSAPIATTATVTPAMSPAASPEAAMGNEMKVILAEENKSGQMGTATLSEANGKTTVTIALTGFTADVSQPAHIHVGVCPGVGDVKYPLTNVVNGKSVTVLNTILADLKAGEPLAINVHQSAKDITVYTACGALPSK